MGQLVGLADALSDGIAAGLSGAVLEFVSGEVTGASVGAELPPALWVEQPATSNVAMIARVAMTAFMSMSSWGASLVEGVGNTVPGRGRLSPIRDRGLALQPTAKGIALGGQRSADRETPPAEPGASFKPG